MSYQYQEIGRLVVEDPRAARERILEAVRRARGYVSDAAARLRVSERSLHRWIVDLDLRDEVEVAKRAAGSPSRGRTGRRRPYGRRTPAPEPENGPV